MPGHDQPWVLAQIERQYFREPQWSAGLTLLFQLRGELDLQTGAQLYHLRPRDLLFLCPYEICYAPDPDQSSHALLVRIDRQLLYQMCPDFDQLDFDLRLIRCLEDDPVHRAVCAGLARIAYAMLKPDGCAGSDMVNGAAQVLGQLVRAYSRRRPQHSLSPDRYAQTRMASILEYISRSYAERVTLEDAAAHVGLHPQYFSTFFKKQMGANFSHYLSTYRVAQSLHALRSSNESILSIAVANGFNTHKAYSAAFQRLHGMLPREYRAQHRNRQAGADAEPTAREQEELLCFFQRYWTGGEPAAVPSRSERRELALVFREEELERTAFRSDMLRMVSVGRAADCLRSDVQRQIIRAKEDIHLEYIHLRDIFSDSLFVYSEDEEKRPVLNWHTLDIVLDFLHTNGLRPLAEIGYMPTALASKKQYAGWQYRPNVSAPRSRQKWMYLVTRFMDHCIGRYGAEEVRQWYFCLWNTPNMRLKRSYWNESREDFFQFYQATCEAMRQADPQLRLGTPNFSYPSGLDWYEAFFAFARDNGISPAFILVNAYSLPDGQDANYRAIPVPASGKDLPLSPLAPELDYVRQQADEVAACAARYGFGGLDIIIGDWNISYMPTDYTRDTCFMAAYIAYTHARLLGRVKALSFWALSDIHSEFIYSDELFHGGPGLMDYFGAPKASYLALERVNRLGREILQVGENYILARDGESWQLLLFNLAFYDRTYRVPGDPSLTRDQRYNVFRSVPALDFHVSLPAGPGEYAVIHEHIGPGSGSAYDIWVRMGRPTDLKGGLLTRYLTEKSLPDLFIEHASGPNVMFRSLVEPHGVTLITISPERRSS